MLQRRSGLQFKKLKRIKPMKDQPKEVSDCCGASIETWTRESDGVVEAYFCDKCDNKCNPVPKETTSKEEESQTATEATIKVSDIVDEMQKISSLLKFDSVKLVGRARDRFKELKYKNWDWRSFYNGWLEGRVDIMQERVRTFAKQGANEKEGEEVNLCELFQAIEDGEIKVGKITFADAQAVIDVCENDKEMLQKVMESYANSKAEQAVKERWISVEDEKEGENIFRDIMDLAKGLHNFYEEQSRIQGWNTQDSCKVEFEDLPKANRRVMIAMSQWVRAYTQSKVEKREREIVAKLMPVSGDMDKLREEIDKIQSK